MRRHFIVGTTHLRYEILGLAKFRMKIEVRMYESAMRTVMVVDGGGDGGQDNGGVCVVMVVVTGCAAVAAAAAATAATNLPRFVTKCHDPLAFTTASDRPSPCVELISSATPELVLVAAAMYLT
jgi:hypothetical protein